MHRLALYIFSIYNIQLYVIYKQFLLKSIIVLKIERKRACNVMIGRGEWGTDVTAKSHFYQS